MNPGDFAKRQTKIEIDRLIKGLNDKIKQELTNNWIETLGVEDIIVNELVPDNN